MLITRKLKEPCPKCGTSGSYGNVNVGKNVLIRGCNACGEWTRILLPDIRKHIIYLDQFFLSHAFRKQEQPFVDAAKRIQDMASRQLVVCPYSSVHTDETHLWRHEQQENLYKFIKQTARGYKFCQAYEIKRIQMTRAFESFIFNRESSQLIDPKDAFRENVHRWDDYFWIDLRPILGDLDAMRQGKTDAIAGLVGLFPEWSKLNSTFKQDVKSEALGYGRSLVDQYVQMAFKVAASGDFTEYLTAPIDSMYIETLLRYDSKEIDFDNRLNRIFEFIASDYFVSIPNVQVSCGLFAVLRKKVKNGSFTNPERAKKKLAGLFYDSECISVFGPYCNAIFIDRAMMQWCNDPEARLLEEYNAGVFSAENWVEFHQYLDQIERDAPEEICKYLSMVYP
jgi:hypothetical protein